MHIKKVIINKQTYWYKREVLLWLEAVGAWAHEWWIVCVWMHVRESGCVQQCVRAGVCACDVCASERVCVTVRACGSMREWASVCESACVRECVRVMCARVSECVRECVREGVCAYECVHERAGVCECVCEFVCEFVTDCIALEDICNCNNLGTCCCVYVRIWGRVDGREGGRKRER